MIFICKLAKYEEKYVGRSWNNWFWRDRRRYVAKEDEMKEEEKRTGRSERSSVMETGMKTTSFKPIVA